MSADWTRNPTVGTAATALSTAYVVGWIGAGLLFGVFGLALMFAIHPLLGVLVILVAVVVPMWAARVKRRQLRERAVRATEQAADWIRANYGREPRDDDEIYAVARQYFFQT